MTSSMATAFANAKVSEESPLVDVALTALARHLRPRGKPRVEKEWTAKLSYKTARYLASKGVALQ